MITSDLIGQVLPIFFLLGLGYWVQRRDFLSPSAVDGLRKIIVNFALPAILFTSFLNLELRAAYGAVFVMIFALCVALFAIGRGLQTALGIQWTYFPFLMTGFAYGIVGVSLYGTVYGLDNIGRIAVFDLGHEFFIWFVFLALLLREKEGGFQRPAELAKTFLRSPAILGILAGILLNLLGARGFLGSFSVTQGLLTTFDHLGSLTIPLILIVVGYGVRVKGSGLRDAVAVVLLRLGLLIPLAFLINAVVTRGWLGLGEPSEAALFTFLVLPPPFIIPLYAPEDLPEEERDFINNTLTLHTLASVAVFVGYLALAS
jgi:hypothetical protein